MRTIVFLLLSNTLFGQANNKQPDTLDPAHATPIGQTPGDKYLKESIYLKGFKYVKNGQEYPIGYWGQHLKKEMAVSPNAAMEFRNFERKRKTAFILSTISVASVVSVLFVDNNDLQVGLLLSGIGLSAISYPLSSKANKSFHKAIWLRNGEILKE